MDATEIIPHSWPDLIRLAVVGLLGYGANTLPALLRRKQSAAETRKTDAEARQIDGKLMIDMMSLTAQATVDLERHRVRAEFQQTRADRLQEERDKLKNERDLLQVQLDKKIRIGDGQ